MNEKLSLQDLVDLLSKKAKITKKDADSFYRELFQLVLERIFDNDFVKIKDFGTFKLISVSSRESVNVNTGEKIEIPSHYKLSFIPDRILKTLVNKPFSQFETILLEDGVVFETSVDNEVDVSDDDIVENTELDIMDDDDDVVIETEKTINGVESTPIIPTIKPEVKEENTLSNTETPKVSNFKPSVNQSYTRSFVYTYTTSESEDKSASITLTVPKDDLSGAIHKPKVDEQTPSQDVPEKKDFPIELKDLPKVQVVDDDHLVDDLDDEEPIIDEEIEERLSPPIENSKLQETQLDDKKDEQASDLRADDKAPLSVPLSKKLIADDIELASDADSEIETEEDVIIPVPVVEQVVKEERKKPIIEKISVTERKSTFSNEDPERPLFPTEEDVHEGDLNLIPLIKASSVESDIADEDRAVAEPANVHNSYAGNNKPTEIRSVSFSDTIDPVDIPYTDYNSPSLNSKFRKWLPVIIFFLVIVGFLTYGLVKMLRKPYDFEYNLGRTNFSLTDTLPFVDEVAPQTKATNTLLDSMKRVQSDLVEDTVKPMKQEPIVPLAQVPAVKQEVESVKSTLVGEADSVTANLINSEKNSFVISDKLQFGIINKAEYHLLKYANGNSEVSATSSAQPTPDGKVAVASKPQYATIQKGTTLRTISTTYYNNPDYWVYIYQTNKKSIGNPNNVPIGTRLLIPALSDYGISNAKDPAAIQTARNLAATILNQ